MCSHISKNSIVLVQTVQNSKNIAYNAIFRNPSSIVQHLLILWSILKKDCKNAQGYVLLHMRWSHKLHELITSILMLFLSSLDNLLYDAYIIFQKDVDNFETEHKTY